VSGREIPCRRYTEFAQGNFLSSEQIGASGNLDSGGYMGFPSTRNGGYKCGFSSWDGTRANGWTAIEFDVLTGAATVAATPAPWLKPKALYPFQKSLRASHTRRARCRAGTAKVSLDKAYLITSNASTSPGSKSSGVGLTPNHEEPFRDWPQPLLANLRIPDRPVAGYEDRLETLHTKQTQNVQSVRSICFADLGLESIARAAIVCSLTHFDLWCAGLS
jgi:hypothetical protein